MDPSQLPDGATDLGQRLGPGGLHRVHEGFGAVNLIEHLLTLVFFLLVLALLAFLAYRLLSRGGGNWGGHSSMALRELELRYARGEIDRDEFLQRRADLTTPGLPPPARPGPPPPAATPPAEPPPPSPTTRKATG